MSGWPVLVEQGRVLPGSPEVVWELITDWENQGKWQLEARDFVVTSPQREGIGVEATATVSIGGITTHDRVLVTEWQANKRLGIEHKGWVSGRAEMRLTPLEPGTTHLFWSEKLYPPWGILGAIGMSLFKPLMIRTFRRDLDVLARLVTERSGSSG